MDNQVVNPSDPQMIAEQVVPYYPEDSKKARYLSYRVSGFSVMESCELAKCHHKSVMRWREADEKFRSIDLGDGLSELRGKLADQYLDIEFTRNFRLVMQKDFEILYKAVANMIMTPFEEQYLIKLRSHYTPQQLAMIKQIIGGGTVDAPFDFTKLTLTLRREKETLEIRSE